MEKAPCSKAKRSGKATCRPGSLFATLPVGELLLACWAFAHRRPGAERFRKNPELEQNTWWLDVGLVEINWKQAWYSVARMAQTTKAKQIPIYLLVCLGCGTAFVQMSGLKMSKSLKNFITCGSSRPMVWSSRCRRKDYRLFKLWEYVRSPKNADPSTHTHVYLYSIHEWYCLCM